MINPAWQKQCLLDIQRFKYGELTVFERTISHNIASQWLIIALSERNIPFKIFNLGAGVKKITTQTDICPKCNGTGKI
jgi:hypothetical protein